jgi:hypothetical protein
MSTGSPFDFSVSLDPRDSTVGPGTPAPREEALFALAPLGEYHLGGGTLLARNALSGRQMTLPADVLNALSHCHRFRSLDEHVADLMEGSDGAPERARAIRGIVQQVRDGGLTLAAADLCRSLAPAPEPAPSTAPIAVVITCDRPAALDRLLHSIGEACEPGQLHRLHVIDDSRSSEHRERNRDSVARCATMAEGRVTYFGPDAARDFVRGLTERLPELEGAIGFLLDRNRWNNHISTGVSRNLAQLLAVGRPLVVFDDDSVCRLYQPEFATGGIELSSGRRQAQFFDDLDAQQERLADDCDAVQRLGRCLGLSLPGALHALGAERLEQRAWRHADAAFAGRLSRRSRVLVTECGTLGDPGTQDYSWLGRMPAESVRRLAGDSRQAALALRHGRCWLGVDRPTFAACANFSQITGFDNRGFLPPYFPFGRGQDRVFGEAVRFLFPDSVALIHPWAALHLRVDGPNQGPNHDLHHDLHHGLHRAQQLQQRWNPDGFPGLLTFLPLEGHADCHAGEARVRLAMLAAAYRDLGDCPPSTVIRLRADQRLRNTRDHLEDLTRSLALSAGGDPAWLDWLLRRQRETREEMSREPPLPAGHEALIAHWQTAWTGFGRGLEAWPDIRAAAADFVQ